MIKILNFCDECGIYFAKMPFPKSVDKQRKFNLTKIGQAVNIKNRYDDLKTGNPLFQIFSIISVEKNRLKIEENRAKNYFANYHFKGEWYLNIPPQLIKDYIKMRKKVLANQETDKEVI